MKKCFFYNFMLFIAILGGMATVAFAEEDFSLEGGPPERVVPKASKMAPGHLKIILKNGLEKFSIKKMPLNQQKKWVAACKNLGDALTVGKGPWGYGAFFETSCWIGPNKIAGEESQINTWELDFSGKDDQLVLAIKNPKKTLEVSLSIPVSEVSMDFFEDREFVDLIAFYLLDGLPASGYLVNTPETQSGVYLGRVPNGLSNGLYKFGRVNGPEELTSYSMNLSNKMYMPKVFGVISNDGSKNESAPKKATAPQPIKWKYNAKDLFDKNPSGLWFHNSEGRGTMAVQLKKEILSANEQLIKAYEYGALKAFISGKIDKSIMGDYEGGYVGLRYGMQVMSGDPLLAKTSFLGIVTEVRGGYLGGVRLYYDKVPKTVVTQDGQETYIDWDRIILGKSFGFKLNKFVDRIEITPKLGIWNFDAKLLQEPDETTGVSEVSAFKMSRAFSLAIEAGAEWYSPKYAVRLWYGFDGAAAIGRVGTKSVTSNRFGVDGFWKAGPRFKILGHQFGTAMLAFIYQESLTISDSSKTASDEETQGQITAVTINNSGYAGVGIALSW